MNRKKAPASMPFTPVIPGRPETRFIKNNIPLFVFPDKTTDIFYLGIFTGAGQKYYNIPLIPSLTCQMLSEGTASFSATALSEAIDYYGCHFMPEAGRDRSSLQMFAPVRHAVPLTDLMFEMYSSPTFPKNRLQLLLKQRLNQYYIERRKVKHIASEAFFRNMFGDKHPYGISPAVNDFKGITSDHLAEFHKRFYRPQNSYFIMAGNVDEKNIEMVSRLFGHITDSSEMVSFEKFVTKESSDKKVFIPVENAVQSAIRIGFPTINKRHKDYPLFQLVCFILGGYFGSRLQRNIREEKGYTYGVSSILASLTESGYFAVVTEAGAEVCNATISEIYKEIDELKKIPVGDKELNTVKNYLSGEFIRMFDGFTQNSESWRAVYDFGMDFSYFKKYYTEMMKATPKQLLDIANRYFVNENFHEIVAGQR